MNLIIPKFPPQSDRQWWHDLQKQLVYGLGVERLQERKEMAEIARAEREVERKTVNGLGQLKAVIPLKTYLRWNEYVPGCWGEDAKDFRKEFYRDNPEVLAAKPIKRNF